MKKFIILLVVAIIAACVIVYARFQFKVNQSMVNFENNPYTSILNKEISAAELATLINKAMNKNVDNEVLRDPDGFFIENNVNSIKMDIKFVIEDVEEEKETDYILAAEQIEKSDLNEFILAFSSAKFKCTRIDYHPRSKLVKYLYIEQLN